MKYTGLTYRPPFEADSLLLQVTAGCSHNRCSFCTMYRDVPFSTESMEQIERDLQEASAHVPHTDRVFLENGDPFCLSADKLKDIAKLIHQYLPEVKTIAMYASVNNIRGKTDGELKELRELGINELNIGVESGLDECLARMNKGYTADEAVYELCRLKQAGIDFGANIIFGLQGNGKYREHAEATAELLNRTQPYLIFTGTIHSEPGCELYEEMMSGTYCGNTVGEILDEEELLLSKLQLEHCYYFGLHPSNIIRIHGYIPEHQEEMIEAVANARKKLEKYLDRIPERYGEGAVVIR